MAVSLDIITRAFRKLNVVALGATPQAAEVDNALAVLRAFYASVFDMGGYGPLRDITVTTAYTALPGDRIATVNSTITAPATAPVRSPYGVNSNASELRYVWTGSAWVSLSAVASNTLILLPDSMLEGLASYLAVTLAPDYGAEPSAIDLASARGLASDIKMGQAAPTRFAASLGVITVADIIRGAARKLIGNDAGALSSYQADVALETLQGIYQELPAMGVFGALWDGIASGDYTAVPQTRLLADNNPEIFISDRFEQWWSVWGAGWDGYGWLDWPFYPTSLNVRPPRDGSMVVVANPDGGDSATYIYDGTAGTWVNLSALKVTDPAPLAQRHSETLKALLATRMADDFGVEVKPATALTAQRGLSNMAMRWDSMREPLVGNYY